MDRQNTNEKKTLKKGRRGWVILAAIVALLGISAGTVVLQHQSSQNQGQCESVNISDYSSKEKEYIKTDTITRQPNNNINYHKFIKNHNNKIKI